MEKLLLYNGVTYSNFTIDEFGVVKNLKTGSILKPTLHKKSGYIMIYLPMGKRGNVKAIRLHKAIAEAFIPNPHNLPVVNHIDEDKTNYSLDNLEWVSYQQNTKKHIEKIERENWFCNNRKLFREDVIAIRNDSTTSVDRLAKKYNVSTVTIYSVKNNNRYKDIS